MGATRFIGEGKFGLVLVGQGGWHPDEVAALTNPDFEEITAVVVQRHPDLVPEDCDLVTITLGLNTGGWSVKVVYDGQAHLLDKHFGDVTFNVHISFMHPTGDIQVVHPDIEPGIVFVPSPDQAFVALVEVAGMEIGLVWLLIPEV